MEHLLAKTLLIRNVVELIVKNYKVSYKRARNMFYLSTVIDLIDDDETGLYGEPPLYVFSLFESKRGSDYENL